MAEHLHIAPIGNDGMYVLDTAAWRVSRPVMDKSRCVECGICLTLCPVSSIGYDHAERKYVISYEFCKGCGLCAEECPRKAISMLPEGGENP